MRFLENSMIFNTMRYQTDQCFNMGSMTFFPWRYSLASMSKLKGAIIELKYFSEALQSLWKSHRLEKSPMYAFE